MPALWTSVHDRVAPMSKEETHDDHGFQLPPHHFKDEENVWWYEENDGLHIVVEQKFHEQGTSTVKIPWRTILAAAKRGGKI